MMEEVSIEKKHETSDGWEFEVLVGEGSDTTTHLVTIEENFWEPFAEIYDSPDELISASFEFLLQREPKESILTEFDLTEITTHFPEYQEELLA
ncbi:MAG: hypothetical protein WEC84_00620 [Candidatus Andersenbacteria bacterium]